MLQLPQQPDRAAVVLEDRADVVAHDEDVNGGRDELNFSEWDSRQAREMRDTVETIEEGSMPPSYYTWFGLHARQS